MMKNILLLVMAASLFIVSCSKDDTVTGACTDGIQNQSETGVDCGGPCAACVVCVTCVSNIQGSNNITYCEDDFQSQADYNAAVANAEAAGRTCQ